MQSRYLKEIIESSSSLCMLFKNIIGLDGPFLIPLPTNTQAAMNEKKRICNSEEMGNP